MKNNENTWVLYNLMKIIKLKNQKKNEKVGKQTVLKRIKEKMIDES
jgi:hypothetical protein